MKQSDADIAKINEWQIQEIRAAVREADAGDFASEKEVEEVFTKYAGS